MSRICVIAAVSALTVAASAAPALAWGHRGGSAFGFGIGFGDYAYDYGNDYDYGDYAYAPGFGVSFGVGPRYGYDYDYGYASYVPAYRYRTVRIVPRYRYSGYAYAPYGYGYDNDYADYAYYPNNDYYYGGSYASVGFGFSDRDYWRTRRGNRISGRDYSGGRRYTSTGVSTGVTGRTSVSEHTSGEVRTVRTGREISANARSAARGTEVRSTVGRSGSSSKPPSGGSGKNY